MAEMGGIGPLSPLKELLGEKEQLLRAAEAEIIHLKEMCKRFEATNDELKASTQQKQDEVTNIEAKFLESAAKWKVDTVPKDEYNNMVNECQNLRLECNGMKEDVRSLSDEKRKIDKSLEDLTSTTETQERETECLRKENERISVEVKTLELSHDSQLLQISELETRMIEIAAEKQRLEHNLESLTYRYNGIEIEISECVNNINKLNVIIGNHIQKPKYFEGTSESEIDKVESKSKTNEESKTHNIINTYFQVLDGNINLLLSELSELKNDGDQKDNKLDIYEYARDIINLQIQHVVQLHEFRHTIREQEDKLNNINEGVKTYRVASSDDLAAEELTAKLNNEIDRLNKELDAFREKTHDDLTEKIGLESKVTKLQCDVGRLSEELRKCNIDREEFLQENEALKLELVSSKKDRENRDAERQEMSTYADNLNRKIYDLFAQMANSISDDEEEKRTLQQTVLQLRDENGKLVDEISAHERDMLNEHARYEFMEKDFAALQNDKTIVCKSNSNLKEKLLRLKDENASFYSRIQTADKKIKQMSKEVSLTTENMELVQDVNRKISRALEQREKDCSILLSSRKNLIDHARQLQYECATLTQQNEELTYAMEGYTEVGAMLEDTKQKVAAYKEESKLIRAELIDMIDRNQTLGDQVKLYKESDTRHLNKQKLLEQELAATVNKGILRDRDVLNLEAAIEMLKSTVDETRSNYVHELDEKQSEVNQCNQRIRALTEEVEVKDKDIHMLHEKCRRHLANSDTTVSLPDKETESGSYDRILEVSHQNLLQENCKLKKNLADKTILETNQSTQMKVMKAKYEAGAQELGVARRRLGVQEGWLDELFRHKDYNIIRKDDLVLVTGETVPSRVMKRDSSVVPLPSIMSELTPHQKPPKAKRSRTMRALVESCGNGYLNMHKKARPCNDSSQLDIS